MGTIPLVFLSAILGQYTPTGIYATAPHEQAYPPTGIYAEKASGYPLRNGRPYYVYVQGVRHYPTVAHLEQGEHSNDRFDPAWLRTLSREDLLWLHGHSHEGIVDWRYAKRISPKPPAVKSGGRWVQVRQCINGRCTLKSVWVED